MCSFAKCPLFHIDAHQASHALPLAELCALKRIHSAPLYSLVRFVCFHCAACCARRASRALAHVLVQSCALKMTRSLRTCGSLRTFGAKPRIHSHHLTRLRGSSRYTHSQLFASSSTSSSCYIRSCARHQSWYGGSTGQHQNLRARAVLFLPCTELSSSRCRVQATIFVPLPCRIEPTREKVQER